MPDSEDEARSSLPVNDKPLVSRATEADKRAAALRENLRKRKAQAAAKAKPDENS